MARRTFLMLAAAVALATTQAVPGMAQTLTAAPPGGFGGGAPGSTTSGTPGGGGGGGGGGGVPLTAPLCVVGGAGLICFHLKPPPVKYVSNGSCCRPVVKTQRLKVFGRMRTVYVVKGQQCRQAASLQQCVGTRRR